MTIISPMRVADPRNIRGMAALLLRLCAALALSVGPAAAEGPDITALLARPDTAPQTCAARAALWPQAGRIDRPYAASHSATHRVSTPREHPARAAPRA